MLDIVHSALGIDSSCLTFKKAGRDLPDKWWVSQKRRCLLSQACSAKCSKY